MRIFYLFEPLLYLQWLMVSLLTVATNMVAAVPILTYGVDIEEEQNLSQEPP